MLILAHCDELSRIYGEDNCSEKSTTRAPDWVEASAFKETRASVASSGRGTVTVTTAVSTADSLRFLNATDYDNSRRSSKIQDRGSSEETQSQGTQRTSHSLLEEEEGAAEGRSEISLGGNPTRTITAWEAGWNVTNAIQVCI